MKFDSNLLKHGIDESLVIYLHSKTKLSDRTITSATYHTTLSDSSVVIKLELEPVQGCRTRQMTLNVDKVRLRRIKFNILEI